MKGIQGKYKTDYAMRKLINGTEKTKPYVDSSTGRVFWGTDSDAHKSDRKNSNGS